MIIMLAGLALAAPLDTDQALLPTGVDMDPDGPWAGYGAVGGRWFSHVGAHASIGGRQEGAVRWAVGLQGFVELTNFTDDYPISFQSFRAHVGMESLWSVPALDAMLPEGGMLAARLGWFHESDHVADDDSFLRYIAAEQVDGTYVYLDYDDNNVSSYEFLRLVLLWRQPWGARWQTLLSATPRAFTPDINLLARRELTAGLAGEARVSVQLTEVGALALGARVERWWHDFDPVAVNLNPAYVHDRQRWQNAELAWEKRHPGGRTWVWALTYSDSSGRGSDFFLNHGPEWGGSLRFVR